MPPDPAAAPPLESLLQGSSLQCAHRLLGLELLHRAAPGSPASACAGVIVEVEAYDETEAASHSFRGRTPRNASMFGRAGLAYVYRSYGMHWCINIVCGATGFGAAVLLRALQPTAGIAAMRARRAAAWTASHGRRPGARAQPPTLRTAHLARGPGCLTQAMGIGAAHDGVDLLHPESRLSLRRPASPCLGAVGCSRRIGIRRATELPWRLYLAGHAALSGPAGGQPTATARP